MKMHQTMQKLTGFGFLDKLFLRLKVLATPLAAPSPMRHSGSGKACSDKENIEKFLFQHASLAPKRYKYSEIKKITFKDKLGQGGFGGVYQGMLPDGSPIAVKVLVNSESMGKNSAT
ncbi:UNVERIFIED_CONTAM: Rust resistance kinase Lr10 [Sesamum indicum]